MITTNPRVLLFTQAFADEFSATELSSTLARSLQVFDRNLKRDSILQVPLVEGGSGTIEHLVTLTLGSFLEVEAKDASGADSIVPLGFAGEEGKLAVVEMKSVSGVQSAAHTGTTYGIGELIQDALDESAFSIILGHDEPVARDYGLGAAAALGVKFLDAKGHALDLSKPIPDLASVIASVDASGRPFNLLSARFYIAATQQAQSGDKDIMIESDLNRLNAILKRDLGQEIDLNTMYSSSCVEFGLLAFLNAEVRDGGSLLLEAASVEEQMSQGTPLVILALDSPDAFRKMDPSLKALSKLVQKYELPSVVIFRDGKSKAKLVKGSYWGEILFLEDAPLFVAPLPANAAASDRRRYTQMRLEKMLPSIAKHLTPSVSA